MNTLSLNNIDKKLIEQASIAKYAQNVLSQFKFENGNTDYTSAYKHFLSEHKKDLVFYKSGKQSGYDVIVLYKSVTRVFATDFASPLAKEIEATLSETMEWNLYALRSFYKAFLAENYKGAPHDNRTRYSSYKPSAKLMCDEALKLL